MEVKVFKFCLNDCGKKYKKEHGSSLEAWKTEDIEKLPAPSVEQPKEEQKTEECFYTHYFQLMFEKLIAYE